ncbi:MAG TPA: DUF3552 domain-containing protein, partial [Actinobacteria bacterium]|nr:DUF3552 domain-containing protein [Actinomycetota bacterium]
MDVIVGAVGVAVGGIFGFLWAKYRVRMARTNAESTAEGMLARARVEAQELLSRGEDEARAKADAYREREDAALEHRRIELKSSEERLSQREQTLEQRAANLAQREQILIRRENETTVLQAETGKLREQARSELERLAGFDANAAKADLLHQVEDEARREAMVLVRDMEIRAREEADRRARRILATAIQRLSSEVVTESTVSVVELPSDEMKGRIIGREGRNIRAFEAITGVNLIVDDTPEAVSVSSFDPVRREVARLALEHLVQDGRIHPASSEEMFEKA